ncbi:hypothetical protein SNOG_13367 [Parastagonospora nodorum SN15]|uniref:Uncharacterized protein n=1 Tax=Phaeosphaeria nodorum (strain SN15 / ATCC MYA-4574 / FGSC 10173) TaxID=321614 RepID=Q0U4E7_PHANO|nr:hypothetical protein SNOG_13367 [Parastagonospora nodorum SN15]EAT79251.1 hypothetical protein SNOG_13367 [Parastagonospora nodorum SN15]
MPANDPNTSPPTPTLLVSLNILIGLRFSKDGEVERSNGDFIHANIVITVWENRHPYVSQLRKEPSDYLMLLLFDY